MINNFRPPQLGVLQPRPAPMGGGAGLQPHGMAPRPIGPSAPIPGPGGMAGGPPLGMLQQLAQQRQMQNPAMVGGLFGNARTALAAALRNPATATGRSPMGPQRQY